MTEPGDDSREKADVLAAIQSIRERLASINAEMFGKDAESGTLEESYFQDAAIAEIIEQLPELAETYGVERKHHLPGPVSISGLDQHLAQDPRVTLASLQHERKLLAKRLATIYAAFPEVRR